MTLLLLFSSSATALNVDTVAVVQRVQQNTSTAIDLQITRDGTPADPEPATATVTITRDDGTPIATNAAATRTDVGHFTYQLAAAQTAQLDWLTATWEVTVDGQAQYASTRVEIVGGFLIGLGSLRADDDLTDTARFPTAKLADARTYAEQELEQACGVAFVPRYAHDQAIVDGPRFWLRPRIRTIRAATRAGASFADPASMTWTPGGAVTFGYLGNQYAQFAQPLYMTNVGLPLEVTYEHGYDQPPAAVSQAALMLAKDYLVRGPRDDRAIQRATEDGPVFIATPGWNNNRFGIPTVDAVVDTYRIVSAP